MSGRFGAEQASTGVTLDHFRLSMFVRRIPMNWKSALAIACCFCGATTVFGQAAAPSPTPAETVAPDIAGVVKGGTKVQLIKAGFQGTEAPIATPDGNI